ncbi:hypothetical protein [Amphritea balenae]|uniref:Uncharacterized protein n=1 Tax=Amphritea balenae TaxID=452629 RepID=A0A3P1SNL4_9GAMM|nr:hypothetical protein [Amphritea balenae]RRC98599.1 hypothetical protein EHS89_13390 [Amphritea balenae]GGK65834.1 hypothetical protein GCM10007941_15050 [Amphritea balenae]
MLSRAKGQVLPLVLFMLATGAVLMVVMFNTTQKATDKSIATNASDAAAYSAGVWVSRNLNYMAYTNRAMVANHVAVGHMVTYVSWIRYVADTADQINRIGRFIPYLSYVTNLLKQMSGYLRDFAELEAEYLVPTIDELNRLIHYSQLAAMADLAPSRVNKVMSAVVKTYDPLLKVNDSGSIKGTGKDFRGLVDASILAQKAGLIGAVQVMSPGNDSGKMRQLVQMSYAGSQRWFNNRSWSKRFFAVFKLRKTASTSHSMGSSLSSWKANDKMRYGRWSIKGWKWSTIGKGNASTGEFDDNYRGIHGYTQVNGKAWLSSDDYPLYMDMVTLTTKKDSQSTPNTRMAITNKGSSISGFGRARVFFKKPVQGFSGHKEEYANLFNPFWNVKLVEPWPGV